MWALSAQVIATALGLLFNVLMVRIYGAEVVGIVAVINSFLIMVTIITLMGTQTSILRLIPEHLAKYSPTSAFKVYRKAQYMVIGVSIITGVLFFFSAHLIADKVFHKPHLTYYFALASIFVIFKSLMLLNIQAVRGLKLIKIFALMQVLPQTFNLVLLIFLGLLWSSRDIPVYTVLGSFALTGMLGWFIMEFAFRHKMRPQDPVHNVPVSKIFFISLPMLMTAAMNFVIAQTGVIMLGIFRSESEVAYYAIVVKLASLTAIILSTVNSMVGPKFSELYHLKKMNELFYVAKKSAKLIFWATVPILLGLIIFGKPIIRIAFGQEFIVAYPALVMLIIGQFVHSVSGATGLFMNMTGNQNVYKNIIFISAVLNISLNLLLTPKYGIYGAATAAMFSLSGWNLCVLCYIKKKYGITTAYFPKIA
jgi:O-antigen/teichoic acid export membrane protein